jgi:transposase
VASWILGGRDWNAGCGNDRQDSPGVFVRKKPIKEICREPHVSRKVVRKVIRSEATEFHYERLTQPLPKIGPWRERLDSLLLENAEKSARERLTLVRLFEELRGFGYAGSYDAVRRYAKTWRKERGVALAQAYVPLTFAPGEAYQFDWSHEVVVLNGATMTVKAAHMRLCHSRMLFVRAYPRETQEMVFDAHDRAFAFFKGACERGIYDNMKTAVETIFAGKDRQYNRRFLQMCGHYLVEPWAGAPRRRSPEPNQQPSSLSKPQAAAKACAGPGGLAWIPGHVSFVANQTRAAPCESSPRTNIKHFLER